VSTQRDPDLDDLFAADPELRRVADLMRARPHPAAHLDPSAQFRIALRRQLMREAWERASKPEVPWYRRLVAPRPLALAGAAVGAMLVGVAMLQLLMPQEASRMTVTVTSPVANVDSVSPATPIELKFSQPMDEQTVREAVSIQPATEVRYAWDSSHTVARITPVHGTLSTNTRYQVGVSDKAETVTHQKVQPRSFSFITIAPTPTPSAQPSATPTSTPNSSLINPHRLTPAGPAAPAWSPDGRLLIVGPNGDLQVWPLQGAPAPVAADGVTLVAAGPDGTPAYLRAGTLVAGSATIPGAQALAIGFRQSGLVFATASDVETADQHRLAGLQETATAADFSPTGDHVAYRAAGGLRIVDLTNGRRTDTLVGPAGAAGAWQADGRRYTYATDGAVFATDGTTTTKLLDVAGVTGLSWSRGGQLLLTTPAGIQLWNGDGALKTLQPGSYSQPLWAPGHDGTLAFRDRRDGSIWVASLQQRDLVAVATPAAVLSQDDLVAQFMAARKNQLGDQASTFLDSAGRDAFTRATLLFSDQGQTLSRYTVLFSQSGRVVVRVVLTRGGAETAVDETLLVQTDGNGHAWVHGVSQVPRLLFGAGPEVTSVQVTGSQVRVSFDSDLIPSTAQSGVALRSVNALAAYDATQKVVTLTVPGGLTSGTVYDLVVSGSVVDVAERTANPYELQFKA